MSSSFDFWAIFVAELLAGYFAGWARSSPARSPAKGTEPICHLPTRSSRSFSLALALKPFFSFLGGGKREGLLMTQQLAPQAVCGVSRWVTWATFSRGSNAASGTGARASDVDDGHIPGLEGRANSVSPSSYLHTLPDDHLMMTSILFSPLIMQLLVVTAAAKMLIVLIVVLPMLFCTRTHRVTMMTTARRTPSKNSFAM